MTIRAMNWAWGIELPPAMKLVLLKLADRANDDGECWPGMDVVAQACGVCERTMMRYIDKMEQIGLLKRDKRKSESGKQQTNLYTLNLDYQPGDNLSPGDDEPGDKSCDNRVTLESPQIRLKPYLETKGDTTDATTKVAAPIVDDAVQFTGTDGTGWIVDETVYDTWIEAYANGRTHQDTEDWIEAELQKARVWLFANPRKRKKNWMRFVTGWLTRASDSMKTRPQRYQQRPYH